MLSTLVIFVFSVIVHVYNFCCDSTTYFLFRMALIFLEIKIRNVNNVEIMYFSTMYSLL